MMTGDDRTLWNSRRPFIRSTDLGCDLSHVANCCLVDVCGRQLVLFSSRFRQCSIPVGVWRDEISIGEQLPLIEFLGFDNLKSFYSKGISLGFVRSEGSALHLYFQGWGNSQSERWRGSIGRMVVSMASERPCLEAIELVLEPESLGTTSLSYPGSLNLGGREYLVVGRMDRWPTAEASMVHSLCCVDNRVKDGVLEWRSQRLWTPGQGAEACSRPSIVKRGELFHLWYSVRSGTMGARDYRIEHRFSLDGISWMRSSGGLDLFPTADTWESEMVCYPFVVESDQELLLYYSGNGFGQGGAGFTSIDLESFDDFSATLL